MANDNVGTPDGTTAANTGFTTDFGVASPGSPADEMGLDVMPPSGDVGAFDPAAEQSLEGDDQEHDRGIVAETSPPLQEALRPRLVEDVEPDKSNVSGPTQAEEGRPR